MNRSVARPGRLSLPQVTLCAVTSINVRATIRALEACLAQIAFARCKLLSDADVRPDHPEIEVISIPTLRSSAAYSAFLLSDLADHIDTPHCLVVQWDGHVLDAQRWRTEFLDYDFIGGRWPQFQDGHDVGNGGFSLRSRRLLDACRGSEFAAVHPEDLAIGRVNRVWLETQRIRFAPPALADLFSTERVGDIRNSFGYHGVFNMPVALGPEAFWTIYRELDDLRTIDHDFWPIIGRLARGRGGIGRATRLIADRMRGLLGIGGR